MQVEDEPNPLFAEFAFFGAQGDLITGKVQIPICCVGHAKGWIGYVPPEIEELPDIFFCESLQIADP